VAHAEEECELANRTPFMYSPLNFLDPLNIITILCSNYTRVRMHAHAYA
jgi:hypothetical protein